MKKKLLAVCVSLSLGALATTAMAQDNNAVQAPDHAASTNSANMAPTGMNANDSDKARTDENMTQSKPMHKPMTHRNVVQNHNGEGEAEARDNGYYTHSKEKADIAWQHKLVGNNSNMNDTPTGWDGASRPATIPKGDNPKWYQTSYNSKSMDNDSTGEYHHHHHKWHHHDMNNENNGAENGEPSTWDKVKQGTKEEAHKAGEATKRGWDKTKEKTTELKDKAAAKMHNNESDQSASSPAPASGN